MLEEGEVPNKKYTQPAQTPKFNMKSTSYRTKVCEHFKKGACLKGNKCSYMHPKEMQNMMRICKYFLGQGCANQQCQYSHDLSKYQCKFYFAMGNCKEQTCRFSHDKWENETAKLQWASDNEQFLKDCLQKRGTTGLGPNYDEQFRIKLMDQFKFMRPHYYPVPQMPQLFQQIQPTEPLEQISDDEQSEEDNNKQQQQVPTQQYNHFSYPYFQPPIWGQKQQILLQQQQQINQQQQNMFTSYEPQQQIVQKQEPIYKLEPPQTYKQAPEPTKTKKIKKPKKKRRETIQQLKQRMKKQKQQKTIKLPADPVPETYKPGLLSMHLGIPIRKPIAQFFLGF